MRYNETAWQGVETKRKGNAAISRDMRRKGRALTAIEMAWIRNDLSKHGEDSRRGDLSGQGKELKCPALK